MKKRDVMYNKEPFPRNPVSEFQPLFDAEGVEIRGEPMLINWRRYSDIHQSGRLVFITARDRYTNKPVGYCCGYLFVDLHWNETIACDDIWYVDPDWRQNGIGSLLKKLMHDTLKGLGATKVYELTRQEFQHDAIMIGSGYKVWGVRWVKKL